MPRRFLSLRPRQHSWAESVESKSTTYFGFFTSIIIKINLRYYWKNAFYQERRKFNIEYPFLHRLRFPYQEFEWRNFWDLAEWLFLAVKLARVWYFHKPKKYLLSLRALPSRQAPELPKLKSLYDHVVSYPAKGLFRVQFFRNTYINFSEIQFFFVHLWRKIWGYWIFFLSHVECHEFYYER